METIEADEAVEGRLLEEEQRGVECLAKYGLSVIKDVEDLGFFGWKPMGRYKKLHQVTAKELLKGTDFNRRPPPVKPIQQLQQRKPGPLKKVKKTKQPRNEYPYNPSYLVPLYVAVNDRGIDPSSLQFLFGGSVLHMLATAKIEDGVEYWVQKVPGTQIVLVEKKRPYTTNWNDFGHQLERFVLGHANDGVTVQHLQVMQIDGHRVLVAAESDGMDDNGNAVEIKSSNPKNWGTKVAFQMISNGSQSLYVGTKQQVKKATWLQSIRCLSLDQVLEKAFHKEATRKEVDHNLQNGLRALHEASQNGSLDGDHPHTIFFAGRENKQLTLHRVSLLPTEREVKSLLSATPVTSSDEYHNKTVGPVAAGETVEKSGSTSTRGTSIVDDLTSRVVEGRLTEQDVNFLESIPPEFAMGYGGYVPEDFTGFGSD